MLSIAIVMPCGFEFLINEVMPGVMRPRLREVVSLPTWLYCYMAYVAMRTPDPLTREMLAYARLIIRETQCHGRSAWVEYDHVFQQQMELDSSQRWNVIHSRIQAATLAGQGAWPGGFARCVGSRITRHNSVRWLTCSPQERGNQALLYCLPPPPPPPVAAPRPRCPETVHGI